MSLLTPVEKISDAALAKTLARLPYADVFSMAHHARYHMPLVRNGVRALAARRVRLISAGLASQDVEINRRALQLLDGVGKDDYLALQATPATTRDVLYRQALDVMLHVNDETAQKLARNIVRNWNKAHIPPNHHYDDALRHTGMFFRHKSEHAAGAEGLENYHFNIWTHDDGQLRYKGGCHEGAIESFARGRFKAGYVDAPPGYPGYRLRQHRINQKLPALIRGVTLLADIDCGQAREDAAMLHTMINSPESKLEAAWFERFQPLVDDLARAAKGEAILNPPERIQYPTRKEALKVLRNSAAIFG